jgi:hypothetical protein
MRKLPATVVEVSGFLLGVIGFAIMFKSRIMGVVTSSLGIALLILGIRVAAED